MRRAPFISIGLILLAGLATDLARSDELKDDNAGNAKTNRKKKRKK